MNGKFNKEIDSFLRSVRQHEGVKRAWAEDFKRGSHSRRSVEISSFDLAQRLYSFKVYTPNGRGIIMVELKSPNESEEVRDYIEKIQF